MSYVSILCYFRVGYMPQIDVPNSSDSSQTEELLF